MSDFALPLNAPSDEKKFVTLYDCHNGNEGHREDYYTVFSNLIGAKRTDSFWKALFSSAPVLIGAIEAQSALRKYAALAVARTLVGRQTAALLFRPLPTLAGATRKMRIKRKVLKLIRRLTPAQTITIMPFAVEPLFSSIAATWIFDPQFWDLHFPFPMDARLEGPLAAELRQAAGGRKICCAIGRQDEEKGFDQYSTLYATRPDLREQWLFASGGQVDEGIRSNLDVFEASGGFSVSRFIDQEELLDLYSCADLIWCSYHTTYDQASGIFGRAMQFGIPVVVREGSLIQKFCVSERIVHIVYDGRPETFDWSKLQSRCSSDVAAQRARQQGKESLLRLRNALAIK